MVSRHTRDAPRQYIHGTVYWSIAARAGQNNVRLNAGTAEITVRGGRQLADRHGEPGAVTKHNQFYVAGIAECRGTNQLCSLALQCRRQQLGGVGCASVHQHDTRISDRRISDCGAGSDRNRLDFLAFGFHLAKRRD